MRVRRLLVVLALVGLAIAPLDATASLRARYGPPSGLTVSGRLRWQFEALLHDVFGSRPVYASSKSHDTNFACAGNACVPHATWDPYAFEFESSRGSSFRLRSRNFPAGAFGNYPMPLRLNGLYIACDPNGKTYLVLIGGATGFPLACVTPIP